MDLITGDKFKTVADFLYAPDVKSKSAYDNLQNTLDLSKLGDINIVYTHTFYVKQLFQLIASLSQKFIIITHNADTNINESFKMPDNILKWYAQNVDIIDPRITSIPIGLENDRWFKGIQKKEKMIEKIRDGHKWINLLYVNHDVTTNPVKREGIYKIFNNATFTTCHQGRNGSDFDNYLDNMYNHKFMICPEGNGIDTHRIWECLYLYTIPVVKRNINNSFYTNLPICFVDKWEEVTEDFLVSELKRITSLCWNYKILTFKYWEDKIKNNL